VQYCMDRGHTPEGMTLPGAAEATPTGSSSGSSSGAGATSTGGSETGRGSSSRTEVGSGPVETGKLTNYSFFSDLRNI
jgi:hypothetical protein